MRAVACAVFVFFSGVPAALFAVGFAHDPTFIVYAPDQALADRVLAKAEEFRKAEAKSLLGAELEAGQGPHDYHGGSVGQRRQRIHLADRLPAAEVP